MRFETKVVGSVTLILLGLLIVALGGLYPLLASQPLPTVTPQPYPHPAADWTGVNPRAGLG
jgi:hypothetical protein